MSCKRFGNWFEPVETNSQNVVNKGKPVYKYNINKNNTMEESSLRS
jgi:hypothetical protein